MSSTETETTAETDGRDRAAARRAEQEMVLPAHSGTALHSDAAAHGRSLLEGALGRPEAAQAAVRSPKRRTTLPAELDRRGAVFVRAGGAHDYSALMRAVLAEYLDQHASA